MEFSHQQWRLSRSKPPQYTTILQFSVLCLNQSVSSSNFQCFYNFCKTLRNSSKCPSNIIIARIKASTLISPHFNLHFSVLTQFSHSGLCSTLEYLSFDVLFVLTPELPYDYRQGSMTNLLKFSTLQNTCRLQCCSLNDFLFISNSPFTKSIPIIFIYIDTFMFGFDISACFMLSFHSSSGKKSYTCDLTHLCLQHYAIQALIERSI